jgi:arylamine N-acetyltransferase
VPDFVRTSEVQAKELLQQFLAAHEIVKRKPVETLRAIGQAFSHLPYENLTKIIRHAETGNVEEARRMPGEVLADHQCSGAGGTCFSLTWTLLQLVRALGFAAEPILADRRYGANTHCALLVWIDSQPHLLDPGYLLVDPLPLPREGEVTVPTTFNQVKLVTQDETKLALHTIQQSRQVHRLDYKPRPVDTSTFLRVWDESFDWEMMTYPLISKIKAGRQWYLQKNHLVVRDHQGSQLVDLTEDTMAVQIAQQFGIDLAIVELALRIVRRRSRR